MKYGAKKDQNHIEIFDALKKCGIVAHDLSGAGCGIPDGIAWVNQAWHLIEIKNLKTAYGRRGLNPNQKRWIESWRGGPVFILKSVDDALAFASGKLESLECVGSGA